MYESSLHQALKNWYTHSGDLQEARLAGYEIDVLCIDGTLIEIQTGNFSAIRPKLEKLLPDYRIRLVYPVIAHKWIVLLPGEGQSSATRRKSPRLGRWEDVFKHLVALPELLAHPNLSLELILVQVEEVRQADGLGSWRRRGVSIADRRLLAVLEQRVFQTPAELSQFVPAGLAQPFANSDLAKQLKLTPRLAGQMTYCLRRLNVLQTSGKRGNALLYTLSPTLE